MEGSHFLDILRLKPKNCFDVPLKLANQALLLFLFKINLVAWEQLNFTLVHLQRAIKACSAEVGTFFIPRTFLHFPKPCVI